MKERFPFLFRGRKLTAGRVSLYAVLKDGSAPPATLAVDITPPGGVRTLIEFDAKPKWRNILAAKETPKVDIDISPATADAGWILQTDSGEVAR